MDPASRVLLFEGRDLSDDSDRHRYWFTAGGAVEGTESLLETASREIEEETGQSGLQLEGPFHHREFDFLNHGFPQHQVEWFFAARTTDLSVAASGWTELEKQVVIQWRWWSMTELGITDVCYFPDNLVDLIHVASNLV